MPPRVSLCLIVKNEEGNLPACLESAADLAAETVIVDTGSVDRTKEVAARFGAKVFDFPWVDDFSAARNAALRQASGEWIFWMDADDRITEPNRDRLRALLAGLKDENAAYIMKCLCPNDPSGGSISIIDHVRLFRNQPGIGWQYRVHEQVRPSLERLHYSFHNTDIEVLHVGYKDPAFQKGKCERNLRLLLLEDAERPNDAFIQFNIGWSYQGIDKLKEAREAYRRSLALLGTNRPFYARKLYAMLARVCRQLGQTHEAMAVCREGRAQYPQDAELLTQEAWLLYLFGDYVGTEARLLQLIQGPAPAMKDGNYADDPGLRGHITRHNLAVLYRDQGRLVEAEAQWRAALVEQPDFIVARLGLGELYLGQKRWRELEEVLARLQAEARTRVQAAVLLAQKHLAFQEYPAARKLVEEAIALDPKDLGPRIVLSRVLLAENRDGPAIEKALREVLALDPNNQEARQNLSFLGQRPGRG
jgi:glycosyltransferase involved in cell wall biosynthesis